MATPAPAMEAALPTPAPGSLIGFSLRVQKGIGVGSDRRGKEVSKMLKKVQEELNG